MTPDQVNAQYLARAVAMFPNVNNNPFVHLDANTREVQICKRVFDLSVLHNDLVHGWCEWAEQENRRPPELTDELSIGSGLLDVGNNWWLDIYFDWYLVFAPELVSRSLGGDCMWVDTFLLETIRNRTVPRPQPSMDTTHLLSDSEAMQYYG